MEHTKKNRNNIIIESVIILKDGYSPDVNSLIFIVVAFGNAYNNFSISFNGSKNNINIADIKKMNEYSNSLFHFVLFFMIYCFLNSVIN